MGSWNELHTLYLAGSIVSIIGALIVIISYIITPQLRYNPSAVIFYRCVINFVLGISLGFLYFMKPSYIINHTIICNNVGHISLFLYLCSMSYLIKLMIDLRTSIKNPFSSPYSGGIMKSNVIIVFIAAISSGIVRLKLGFLYGQNIQFCSIQQTNIINGTSINLNTLIFVWMPLIVVVLYSIYVTIYSFVRLRKGLPNTFNIRRKVIRNSWFYCIIYTLYFGVVSLCSIMTYISPKNDDIWYKLFALSVSGMSIADFIVFIIINSDKLGICCGYNEEDIVPNIHTIQQNSNPMGIEISKLAAKSSHDYEQINGIKPKKKNGMGICARFGISIVDNNNDNKISTINDALRREVLAYTTDGIVQAVCDAERIYTRDIDIKYCFPTTMSDDDEHNNAFQVQIKANDALLHIGDNFKPKLSWKGSIGSSESGSIILDGCCIKSMAEPYEQPSNTKKRKFVDYAPLTFKYIRNYIMGITDSQYKRSMIPGFTKSNIPINEEDAKKQLSVLDNVKTGEGKSGAFFYISHDQKYVVKTIPKHEVKKLIEILPDYVKHLQNNTQTIIAKYVGLHSINIYGLTLYFVAMENVFTSNVKPNEMYDLKGSWVSRYTNYKIPTTKTMKDLDLKRLVILNSNKREKIIKQLEDDTEFLMSKDVMDYSLLLGICYMKIEFDDDNEKKQDIEEEKVQLTHDYLGGVRADIMESPGLYYFGIIDTLQAWTFKKKMEHWAKVCIKRKNPLGISCIEPIGYKERFNNYMKSIIISGEEYKTKLGITHKFEKEQVLIYPSSKNIDDGLSNIIKQKSKMPPLHRPSTASYLLELDI